MTKIGVVTTTINVPDVLRHFDPGPDVRFFIAIDEQTPDLNAFAPGLGNVEIVHGGEFKSSELIGWKTDSRRNFAVLAALRWGADIIVSTDDDMMPLDREALQHFALILDTPFYGLQLGVDNGWIDTGKFTTHMARQRGLPVYEGIYNNFSFAGGVRVGVAQGIILGIPDTDAATTIAAKPFVHSASDVLKAGMVANPRSRAVFNSQWTAFRRELAPAFFQHYAVQGRNTDIIASLIMRRIMRDRDLYTYYGPPMGFHNRSMRDPRKDMQAEMWGLERVSAFAQELSDMIYLPTDKSVVEQVRHIAGSSVLADSREVIKTWCDDCEAVL